MDAVFCAPITRDLGDLQTPTPGSSHLVPRWSQFRPKLLRIENPNPSQASQAGQQAESANELSSAVALAECCLLIFKYLLSRRLGSWVPATMAGFAVAKC